MTNYRFVVSSPRVVEINEDRRADSAGLPEGRRLFVRHGALRAAGQTRAIRRYGLIAPGDIEESDLQGAWISPIQVVSTFFILFFVQQKKKVYIIFLDLRWINWRMFLTLWGIAWSSAGRRTRRVVRTSRSSVTSWGHYARECKYILLKFSKNFFL